MIAIGFCNAMIPVMKRICLNSNERIEFLQRHLRFFNAHPYFSTYALGSAARLEEQREYNQVIKLKEELIGPLGFTGDLLFWQIIRPSISIIGVCIALIEGGIAGPIFFFLCYNFFHLYFRWRGIKTGYIRGSAVDEEFQSSIYRIVIVAFRYLGAYGLGLLIILGISGTNNFSSGWIFFIGSTLIAYPCIVKYISPSILLIGLFVFSIIVHLILGQIG